MKKLITLTCLLGAFVFNAKAENKALIVNADNPTETLTISDGEVATVLFWGLTDISGEANVGRLDITIGGKTIVFSRDSWAGRSEGPSGPATVPAPSFSPVVPGPATIKLVRNQVDSMLSVKIENNSSVGKGNNITVLPKETENMELILESSDDMVKWEKDVIGDKPKANRKKFYRLRAVKK